VSSDSTGATIDGADNVTVGKSNVQQVVNVGHDGHDDHDHAATIRIVYELVSNLTVKIDAERHERYKMTEQMRKDLDELRRIAHETQRQVEGLLHKAQAAVTVNQTHRIVFTAGFALLMLPLPLFYNDVRLHVGVSWQFALTMAVVCYLFSAVAWSYMWWGK
jgi:hypothetical protein